MKKAQLHINIGRGFSLVEMLVAISVFLIFILTTMNIVVSTSRQTSNSSDKEKAVMLAHESIEAVRNIRDADFNNLVDGTYGLATISNHWVLSGSFDITDIFNRQIVISTINSNQKKIIVTITWSDQITPNNSVVQETYLTAWKLPLSIGLTMDKIVINHGGVKVPSDFLPNYLSANTWDNTVDPPILTNVDTSILWSPLVMSLGSNTYNFLTTSNTNYTLSLASSCTGGVIILSNGDSKICTITYEENVIPTVVSPTVTTITSTTANLGANVTYLGNPSLISERGTCLGTTPAPSINCVAEGNTTTGVFTQSRTGLIPGTLYYYRGYATNTNGTAYSTDGSFTTSGGSCSITSIVPTVYDNSGSISAVISKPVGVVQNDIMFAYILHNNSTDRLTTIPSGWTQIGRHKNGSSNQALYYKVAGASEPTTYTFGLSSSSRFAITINAYRGCFNLTTPINIISNTGYATNNTTYRAASMTLTAPYSMVVVFPSVNASGSKTFTAPTTQGGGWTQDYINGNASSQFSRSAYSKMITASGSTGVIDSIGFSASTGKHSFAVGLKPL